MTKGGHRFARISEALPRGLLKSSRLELLDVSHNSIPGNFTISPYQGDAMWQQANQLREVVANDNLFEFDLSEEFFSSRNEWKTVNLVRYTRIGHYWRIFLTLSEGEQQNYGDNSEQLAPAANVACEPHIG